MFLCSFTQNLEETQKFFHWCQKTQNSNETLYHFLYETGLRISELQALRRECVNLTGGIVEINSAYSRAIKGFEKPKSGLKRSLGTNTPLRVRIGLHLQSHNSVFVFPHRSGKMMPYETLSRRFKSDQRNAGLSTIMGLHGLRHTFASHFVMGGGSIYDLQKLLGHSDISTTQKYAHHSPNYLKEQSQVVCLEKIMGENVVSMDRTQDSRTHKKRPAMS